MNSVQFSLDIHDNERRVCLPNFIPATEAHTNAPTDTDSDAFTCRTAHSKRIRIIFCERRD